MGLCSTPAWSRDSQIYQLPEISSQFALTELPSLERPVNKRFRKY